MLEFLYNDNVFYVLIENTDSFFCCCYNFLIWKNIKHLVDNLWVVNWKEEWKEERRWERKSEVFVSYLSKEVEKK